MQMSALFLIGIGYLLGSIPSGYLAGKWFAKIDIREIGSGSTGATNVLREVGKAPALAVFVVDILKGFVPVMIAKWLLLDESLEVVVGIAALSGHIWPIWLNWKGGKAVATGLGVFLAISWTVGLASLGIFLTIFSISKIVSLSSIFAAISLPFLMIISFNNGYFIFPYLAVSLAAMLLVIWRHRSNIKRLLEGKESKISKSI